MTEVIPCYMWIVARIFRTKYCNQNRTLLRVDCGKNLQDEKHCNQKGADDCGTAAFGCGLTSPAGRKSLAQARKPWVTGKRNGEEPRRGDTLTEDVFGSYCTPCFFNTAMNSCSKVILR